MSARNRELLALVPASLLITLGFAAVFVQEDDRLTNASLTYGALFLGLCVAAHLVVRFTLPYADPYLFPLAATLACFGLVMIYRIDDTLAREQAQWFVVGLLLFAGTIVFVRDITILERYRYVIASAGIVLLLLPRVPGLGSQVNGAYLGVESARHHVPAGRVREDRDRHLPGQLPARHAPAAGLQRRAAFAGHHVPAPQAPRARCS